MNATSLRNWARLALTTILAGLPAALSFAQDKGISGLAADAELVETRYEIPRLSPPAAYVQKGDVVEIELSNYAGYAGLVVANGGLEPSDNSVFAKKHGFKVKLTLSEEESWSALNSGKMAASATTTDVLAVYGRQFQILVPAQIGFSRGADGIVVKSDIKRINQLRGKIVASAQFTEADFFLRYLAQEAGIGVHMLKDFADRVDADKINVLFCSDGFGAGDLFLRDLKAGRNRLAGCVTWAPKTTEVVDASAGKAHLLVTNRNLLVVADVLVVNKGFAQASPKIVAGLVAGLLEGNQMVRDQPDAHLDLIGQVFGWSRDDTRIELNKVHLANLPESLAFFKGTIDSAGSFGGIYQSAVLAYGQLLQNAPDSDRFLELAHLLAIEQAGTFAAQRTQIAPIKTDEKRVDVEKDPLLSKDIRFFFQPNSADLDMKNEENLKNLDQIKGMLQVSPGSTVTLVGHVDNARVEEFRAQGGEAQVNRMALQAIELSKRRANEVRTRLLARHSSIDQSRLSAEGRGWKEPAGKESEKNRRVEVQWFTVE